MRGGLIAQGGCLSVERLQRAYRQGIFPWFSEDEPILWWQPVWRAVLFPHQIHINRSLRKFLRKKPYCVTLNHAFSQVIRQCASVPRGPGNGTWITEEMIQAYIALHHAGTAHSVEVWQGEQLVGGLYGVLSGTVFAGESMFSLQPNASKVALLALAQTWQPVGLRLIDCQIMNDHLERLGAFMVSRSEYTNFLHEIQSRKNEQIPIAYQTARELIFPDVGNPR